MSDKSRTENNRNENSKEEKLFRAMSGVDEELLLRSEQSGSNNTGKVHKFPMRYVTRIAAACLCLMVAGVLYVTMSGTKMADSTSADTAGNECAAPQLAYSITAGQEIPEEALDEARSGDTAAGAESEIQSAAAMAEAEEAMPEGETAKDSIDAAEVMESDLADSGQQAAFGNSADEEKQSSLESAKTESTSQESVSSVSGNDSSNDSTEAAPEDDENLKKQGRQLPEKMTVKGQ